MSKRVEHQITPMGKWEKGEIFRIKIRIPMELGWIEQVNFWIGSKEKQTAHLLGFKRNDDMFAYFEEMVYLETKAMYLYHFSFRASGTLWYYTKGGMQNSHNHFSLNSWKLSVGFQVPDWAKGAIMYHIFVDRYRKAGNGFLHEFGGRKLHQKWEEPIVLGPNEEGKWNVDYYAGNLQGITETLSYLKKLGVSILFLSPIVQSQSNHRYDASDYTKIDPYAGSEDDLRELCQKAHQKGMHIILDGVFNHTGNDSVYFNEYQNFDSIGAFQSKESPYFPWYRKIWKEGKSQFDYWWGMKNLPVCDGENPSWQNFIYGEGGVIDHWFSLGIDGLRLDVADELSDTFIEGILKAVQRNKSDGFVLGEVWKNPMRMNRGYLSSGKGMHSVMNYPLVDALVRFFRSGDAASLDRTLREIQNEYPDPTIPALMNFTSTHDISRAIHIQAEDCFSPFREWVWDLADDRLEWVRSFNTTREKYLLGKKRLKSYYTAIIFLPGIASIFYGDEVGALGIGNLANRIPYPWSKRDKKLLSFFRKLGKIREKNPFLKTADLKILQIDEDKLVFERRGESGNKIFVWISRKETWSTLEIPDDYRKAIILFQEGSIYNGKLSPYGSLVLHVKEERA